MEKIKIVSELVSWCFEPSQSHRITSGLNTNVSLSPSYSFHKSFYYMFFFCLFIFRGHSTREPAFSRVTYFILWAYTGTVLVTANRGKNWERFWKNAGEWTGRAEIRKKSLVVSVPCMAIY